MAAAKELLQMDLYGLLGVDEGATEKEVWNFNKDLLSFQTIMKLNVPLQCGPTW